MEMTAEATYVNGVLKLDQPAPYLKEGERVRVTIATPVSRAQATAGMIPCKTPEQAEALRHFAESSVYELEEEDE